jgi:transcriptional regulator with XRE-family HTH domain
VARSGPPVLGEFIRSQRELHELSMRELARMAGISNPYLSQIERGLREPSERVLEAIARSLELSAETLFDQAGLVTCERSDRRGAPRRPPRPNRRLRRIGNRSQNRDLQP